jgi:prepilin-type N-terminal cleavage/methylation domain-containing protein
MMKGLTLFEVLVSLLIFSIVAMGLGYAVIAGKSALFVSDIPTQLRQNVLFSLMPMVRALRQTAPAKINIGEGASSTSITFQLPHDNNGDGVIVDTAGNVEWGPNAITYARNAASQLTRTCAGVTSVIAPNITSLQFSRPVGNDTLLQIDITASKTDSQGKLYQDTDQAIIKMRN